MGEVIQYSKIRDIVARERSRGKKIVFTSGGFDCLHAGHLKHLEFCANYYKNTALFVAIASDKTLRLYKGPERPCHGQRVRAAAVADTEYANYVVINTDDKFDGKTHRRILEILEPDVWIMPKGHFYATKRIVASNLGIKVKTCERHAPRGLAGISTSRIIDEWRTALRGTP